MGLSHQFAGSVALAGLDADSIDTIAIGIQGQHHFLSAFQHRVVPLVHHPALYVVKVVCQGRPARPEDISPGQRSGNRNIPI